MTNKKEQIFYKKPLFIEIIWRYRFSVKTFKMGFAMYMICHHRGKMIIFSICRRDGISVYKKI